MSEPYGVWLESAARYAARVRERFASGDRFARLRVDHPFNHNTLASAEFTPDMGEAEIAQRYLAVMIHAMTEEQHAEARREEGMRAALSQLVDAGTAGLEAIRAEYNKCNPTWEPQPCRCCDCQLVGALRTAREALATEGP